jgi:hypothetical protein
MNDVANESSGKPARPPPNVPIRSADLYFVTSMIAPIASGWTGQSSLIIWQNLTFANQIGSVYAFPENQLVIAARQGDRGHHHRKGD